MKDKMTTHQKGILDKTLELKNNKPRCWYCKYEAKFITRKTWGQPQKICGKCGALQYVVRPRL